MTSSARPSRRSPAYGQHDGVELAAATLRKPGVDVAAHAARCPGPSPSARSCAARRGEPVPTREPVRQLAEGQPVAGDQRVARILARRHGAR